MTKTDVAETKDKNTEVATAATYDYGDMAHAGYEDTKVSDLSIPFLNIMQTNSEIVEDELIPGVKPGDIVNSVTNEIMKQPIAIIPVHKEEAWVEWRPRRDGGGVMARFEPNDDVVLQTIKKNGGRIPPKGADNKRIPFAGPNGGELVETYYVYVLILDENEVASFAVLAFSSTKVKPYKDWITAMYMQKGNPPMFANRATVQTVKQKNNDGTFFNFAFSPMNETWKSSLIHPVNEAALLKEAVDFREMIQNGLAAPDYGSVKEDDSGSTAGGSGKRSGGNKDANDEEMPF